MVNTDVETCPQAKLTQMYERVACLSTHARGAVFGGEPPWDAAPSFVGVDSRGEGAGRRVGLSACARRIGAREHAPVSFRIGCVDQPVKGGAAWNLGSGARRIGAA